MRKLLCVRKLAGITLLLALGVIASRALAQRYLSGLVWPEPAVVTPGEGSGPPADAVVLFDGKNFDAWDGAKGWNLDPDGGFTSKGVLKTKQSFGDCQLHLEFASPKKVKGKGQGRGNNGVGLMGGRYEIQVLDSYENKTYPEGQCAAVYNQTPPLVDASRKPGEWQSYDILFTAPRFDAQGKVRQPAYITMLHNGIVVHNHTAIQGKTANDQPPVYTRHADKLPLVLMYHGDPVRFRNIWIRTITEVEGKPGGKKSTPAARARAQTGGDKRFRFAKADVGKVPEGWKAAQTNEGEGSVWRVVADEAAPSKTGLVLAQTAESPSAVYNLCVAEKLRARDVELTVAFKALTGKKDQGGGIVWRYQDANNYYVARVNPLEDNYRAYKVVAGKRIQLATREDVPVPAGEWHKLRVKMAGNHIECSLDGKKLLDVRDDTFAQAGQVGLWTKADARTAFDDFVVTSGKE